MSPLWLLAVCAAAVDAAQGLIARALDGDRRAMRGLVDRVMPVIRSTVRYGLRRGNRSSIGPHDGDDLVQEVWAQLFQDDAALLRRYDPSRGTLEGYVTVVTRSKTRGEYHKAASQRRGGDMRMDDVDDARGVAGGHDPEAEAMSHELARRLRERLGAELSERGRLVFTLVYVDGKKPAEAARLMKVKTQVIYNWQHKIRGIIRAVRQGMEPAPA